MRSHYKIHSAAELAAAFAVFLFTIQVPTSVRAQGGNPASSSDCRSEQGLSYLCGFVVPEDVLIAGSTGLVLASGHRAPGDLYLIDPAAGTWSELIHSPAFQSQHDTETFPECPGPLNLEAFDVHGLSLAETSPRRFSLYTTSHGEREAIEIYDLDLRRSEPVLTWKGCVLLEQDGYHNSVARLADGGFVTTRMRGQNQTTSAPGEITGHVVEWHPGGQLQALAGTDLSRPNGIDVSPDERYVYVTAATREVVRFDRSTTPIGKRAVSTPMSPDNIHWDSNGKLLSAGPNPAGPASCASPPCRAGWTAIEIDPETLAVSRLGGADGTAAMQRASAAMRVGNEIWVGSNEDRIGRFPAP
jgi:hypothetical protein